VGSGCVSGGGGGVGGWLVVLLVAGSIVAMWGSAAPELGVRPLALCTHMFVPAGFGAAKGIGAVVREAVAPGSWAGGMWGGGLFGAKKLGRTGSMAECGRLYPQLRMG